MEKVCTKCGNEYSKDIKYCVRCGSTLVDKKSETIPRNEQSSQPRPQHEMQTFKPTKSVAFKKSRPLEKIIIPAIIIAILLSLVAIALPMTLEENKIAENSIGTDQIIDDSVTGEKILDGTITDDDINNNGLSKLADDSVNSQTIHDGTIDTNDLSDGAIKDLSGLILIENNSITGNKILDGTIDTIDLKDNAITSGKILDGTITSSDIGSGAVSTDEIANDSVTFDKMNIKIKFGKKLETYNDTTITHGLGRTPSSVIVTPIYDTQYLNGAYAIYANVYDITSTSFKVGLWYITFTSPPEIHELNGAAPFTSGVSVNWVAIG